MPHRPICIAGTCTLLSKTPLTWCRFLFNKTLCWLIRSVLIGSIGLCPNLSLASALPTTLRVAHVDLDYVYDPDPLQTRRNTDVLVRRIIALGVNTVFLQAFADPTGDGLIRALYFPNRHLPMRADLFKPVSDRLRNEAGVVVFAWMPVLAFDLRKDLPRVRRWQPGTGSAGDTDTRQYQRLSPFDADARSAIEEIYEDLSRHTLLDGLLFHDDALLGDFEDASDAALTTYKTHGFPASVRALRADARLFQRWTRLKTRTLTQFTLRLLDRAQAGQTQRVMTARNIYARPVLDPESRAWFSQDFDDFLSHYDVVAVMAMPLMEGITAHASTAWIDTLIDVVATHPQGLAKTLFELQTKDWSLPDNPAVQANLFEQWLIRLQAKGVRHIGYYPDDFHRNEPVLEQVRPYLTAP